MWDVVVIGGGASGLIAASEAAGQGLRVLLAEKNDRVGKKLLATGNGRCNLSNEDFSLSHYHGSCLSLAEGIFSEFGPEEVESYWNSVGIDLVVLENGKKYPRSLQASSVLNALRRRLEDTGVELMTDTQITGIRPCQGGYLLDAESREVQGEGKNRKPVFTSRRFKAGKVILCAGGKASPAFGANGEGAALAKSLGMSIVPLRPAICRLLADSPYCKRLAGTRITVPASLNVNGKIRESVSDEILFTEDGLSGPAILALSRETGEALSHSADVRISLDLVPEMEKGELFAYLMSRLRKLSGWNMEDALEGWLTKKLISPVLNDAGIDRTESAGDLQKKQISSLTDVLKNFQLSIRGLDGFKEAQVTVGGVRGDQILPNLESGHCPGFYLCGEVVDLDGDCGGYNLLWAAASALKAAQNVSCGRSEDEYSGK